MTPAEKLDEIVRALEQIATKWSEDPREDAARALTLARELRQNAVVRWFDRDEIADQDDPYWHAWRTAKLATDMTLDERPAECLILSDPTP